MVPFRMAEHATAGGSGVPWWALVAGTQDPHSWASCPGPPLPRAPPLLMAYDPFPPQWRE